MATVNLKSDSISKLIWQFSLPAILSYFVSELYNLVDTYFVGNAVGGDAVGALGAVFPIQRLVIALSLLFAFAAANRVAYLRGEENHDFIPQVIYECLLLNFIFLLPLILLTYLFSDQLLHWMGAGGRLTELAHNYLLRIIPGSIFLTLSTTLARILLAFGKNTVSLLVTVVGAVTNIILDMWLVNHLGMGVAGAAWATLLSQIVGFVVTLVVFIITISELNISFRSNCSWRPQMLKSLILQGLPSFVIESEDAVVLAVLNNIVFSLAGEDGVSILALNIKVYMFLFVVLLGFAYGMQPILAFNKGAGDFSRVRRCLKTTVFISIGVMTMVTLLFYIIAPQLLGILVDNQTLLNHATPLLRLMLIALPLLSFYYAVVMYYQAAGNSGLSLLLSVLRQLLVLLPLACLSYLFWANKLKDIFIIYPITDLWVAILGLFLLRRIFVICSSSPAGGKIQKIKS